MDKSTVNSRIEDLACRRTSRRRAADAKFKGIRVPLHSSEAGAQACHVAIQVSDTGIAPHEQGAGQERVLAGVGLDQLVLAAEDVGEHLEGRQQGRAAPATNAATNCDSGQPGSGPPQWHPLGGTGCLIAQVVRRM